jgi:hypothetical protein
MKKTKRIWLYLSVVSGVVFAATIGSPLRANNNSGYACSRQWVITFPSGQGNPLYCAQFEDGSQRCSVDASDVPTACDNPSLRDSMLMLR